MAEETSPPEGGCGCVHLAVPVFLLAGGVTGFRAGSEHGLGWGLLGGVGGVVAGFLAFVAVLLAVVAIVALSEKWMRPRA